MTALAHPTPLETPRSELDAILARLSQRAPTFARLSVPERLALLGRIQESYEQLFADAVREGCRAKGLDLDTEAGEEWLAHPFCLARHLRLLRESLLDIGREGAPRLERTWIRERGPGRLAVRLYPTTRLEAVAFPGIEAEAWMRPGMSYEQVRAAQAPFYRHPHAGRVALVLGAGNVPSIPSRDALTKMFNEGTVVVLKMNPVNAWLGPYLERAFQAAIEAGYFAVVYGGAEVGGHLAHDARVDEVHITGSDKTHDAIVWGPPGPEREARMARGEPLLTKEITSELGNISPVLVVPGPYTAAELDFLGRSLAGMCANNASFNCNTPRLLVHASGWADRPRLLAALERTLDTVPNRIAYYPGAAERYRRFTAGRAGLKELGPRREGALPWALLTGLDPSNAEEPCFRQESWCSVLAETALEASDPVTYLERAVPFANERLWGTLCATLIVHPKTAKDPSAAAAIEKAIEQLRYGTVTVNLWPAVGFTLSTAPWGGHPSSSLQDIQSGRGWTNNTKMLEGVEKVVIRAPLIQRPKPVWFPDHRTLPALGRRVTDLEKRGSWAKLPALAVAALRG